ncbi:hypothetical protein Fot_12297 [Forsythia ovata]|uniref:Uncharacterized protein n=1 Tax=Forsythia ovata TaxID=205694 RepID=A0ABD1WM51_9LAMI
MPCGKSIGLRRYFWGLEIHFDPILEHILNLSMIYMIGTYLKSTREQLGELWDIDLNGMVHRVRVKVDVTKPSTKGTWDFYGDPLSGIHPSSPIRKTTRLLLSLWIDRPPFIRMPIQKRCEYCGC